MITAKEWMCQSGGNDSRGEPPPLISINRQIIKEIQLDAYTQGIRDTLKALVMDCPVDNVEFYLISKSGLRL